MLRIGQEVEWITPATIKALSDDGSFAFIQTKFGQFYVPVGHLLTFPEPADLEPNEEPITGGDGSC